MNKKQLHPLVRATGLGFIAGIRSMAAPAVFSRSLSAHDAVGSNGASTVLRSAAATRIAPLLAMGEMIADKASILPRRTRTVPLLGRLLIGGLCGMAVAGRRGALAGSAAALGTTLIVPRLRQRAVERFGVPDAIVGLVEDGVVLATGWRLSGSPPQPHGRVRSQGG